MASYIGKNINMALLILLIAIVILLVSVTVFFQFGLTTRTSAYESTSENLTTCESRLQTCNNNLDSTKEQLSSTAKDIGRYDQLYETKVAELGETEGELDSANRQISTLQLIKTGLEEEKSGLQQDKRVLEQTITSLNTQIDTLEDDVSYWKGKFNCCKDAADCSAEC